MLTGDYYFDKKINGPNSVTLFAFEEAGLVRKVMVGRSGGWEGEGSPVFYLRGKKAIGKEFRTFRVKGAKGVAKRNHRSSGEICKCFT